MLSPAVATNTGQARLVGYLPVSVDMLKHVNLAPVDVFVQPDRNQIPTLYCQAGLPLNNQQLLGLAEAGVRDVYVRTVDAQDFGVRLLESIESVPAADRLAALQFAVAVEIEHTMRRNDCGEFVALSDKVGRGIVSLAASSGVLPRDLYRIARHDFDTFVHVTNVASYSTVLAKRFGITDEADLRQIATAAMLHDIGKRLIPKHILNKRIRLNPDERDQIESHPTRGYEVLCERADLTTGQLMIVYQHHERVDGTGYPVRLPACDIHPGPNWSPSSTCSTP
jgi:HD-GYP domain-containing protein (c-di-GMP phosphodiesterase class II)